MTWSSYDLEDTVTWSWWHHAPCTSACFDVVIRRRSFQSHAINEKLASNQPKKRSNVHVEKDMPAIHTQPKTKRLSGFTVETQRCSIMVSPQYQINLNCSKNRQDKNSKTHKLSAMHVETQITERSLSRIFFIFFRLKSHCSLII